MNDGGYDDEAARDIAIQSQPILWARALLEEAESVRGVEARDAILARIGICLLYRFGIAGDADEMRTAARKWVV